MAGMGAAAGVRGASGARRGRFAALRSRNFAILWCAGIVSNAGAQMQDVAKIWLIVQRTNSAVALALLGLCFAVPMTLLPPIGGALADRVDRVTVLKGTQSLMTLQPLLLAGLLATGHAPLWVLYADTVVAAAVYAANSPAQQALLPALVPREDLLNATALQSSVWTGARLVGPALGGLLLIPLGAAWLFAVNGLTTLFVLAALFGLRGVPGREPAAPGAPAHGGSGLRYVLAHRPVLVILALTAGLTVLQGAYAVLLPFFARDVWHAGARGYGLLLSATGAGALLGTFGLAALGDVRRKGLAAGGGALLYCGALLLFAHAPIYTLGLALLVLVGLAYAVANAVLATLLQLLVPGSIRGRVMALRSIAYIGLGDFGGLFSGGLAQLLGPAAALTCGVVALLALVPAALRPLGAARPDAPEISPVSGAARPTRGTAVRAAPRPAGRAPQAGPRARLPPIPRTTEPDSRRARQAFGPGGTGELPARPWCNHARVRASRPRRGAGLPAVLRVGDVPAPGDGAARIVGLLHGDVRHEAVGGCAVPVVLARLEIDPVAGADDLDGSAPAPRGRAA